MSAMEKEEVIQIYRGGRTGKPGNPGLWVKAAPGGLEALREPHSEFIGKPTPGSKRRQGAAKREDELNQKLPFEV